MGRGTQFDGRAMQNSRSNVPLKRRNLHTCLATEQLSTAEVDEWMRLFHALRTVSGIQNGRKQEASMP